MPGPYINATGADGTSGQSLSALSGIQFWNQARPATMTASASIPPVLNVGQWVVVTMTVTNQGGTPALGNLGGVAPSVSAIPPGSVTQIGGISPAGPQTITGGAAQTFSWTLSVNGGGPIAFTFSAGGTTCGTEFLEAVVVKTVTVQTPARLAGRLAVALEPVTLGEPFTLVLSITNLGQEALTAVRLAGLGQPVIVPANAAVILSGSGGPVALTGGASTVFTWAISPHELGPVTFSATVLGIAVNTGATVMVFAAFTTTIYPLNSLILAIDSLVASPQGVPAGDPITVVLTVRNPSPAAYADVVPALLGASGDGGVTFTGGPSPASSAIPSGGTATFTWTWRAETEGTVRWTASATAVGGGVLATEVQSNEVLIYKFRGDLLVYPNPFNREQATGGTVKFAGLKTGGALRLYTTRGLLVWEGVGDGAGHARWDGRNREQEAVAPGVYLWAAETARGKARGSLIVE